MNKVAMGILAVVVIIVLFLLLDSEKISKVDNQNSNVNNTDRKTENISNSTNDIKIEYTENKTVAKEPKIEKKVEVESKNFNMNIDSVINKNSLVPIKSGQSDEDRVFKDNSGRYEANILVNTSSYRDPNSFPQIPILATFELPSGESIKAQVDPTLSTDKSFLKVKDSQTGEEFIYDVSDLSRYKSAQDIKFSLNSDGSSNSQNSQSDSDSILPPAPPR